MGRVSWSGERTLRLSTGAIALLMRLCAPGATIQHVQNHYDAERSGQFHLCLDGEAREIVRGQTVEILATARLVTRQRGVSFACYGITERARMVIAEHLKARCARLGHDAFMCSDPDCHFDPFQQPVA